MDTKKEDLIQWKSPDVMAWRDYSYCPSTQKPTLRDEFNYLVSRGGGKGAYSYRIIRRTTKIKEEVIT